ncbi:MAG TPA: hypothetical protein GXX75_17925 [Clostridiales bacterium]|nr:hypothetical protein [Clostridiales bacterium]
MTEQELREKNLDTVKQYFQLHGSDRLRLFTEDGAKTIPFNPSHLKVFSWRGKEQLTNNFEFNKQDLKSWEFKDMEFYPGLDPNLFLVRCIGEGFHTRGSYYKNFYLFTFRMKDGLIQEIVEYMNPINGMVADGFVIPGEYLWDDTKLPFSELGYKF